MKVTAKGQVTIPAEIRLRLGLLPGCEVEFEIEGETVRIRKVRRSGTSEWRGIAIVEQLRGRGSVRMTTDEILALTRGAC